MTLVLILIAGLMGASGVVLAAAAAHAKSGMGLDGAGYLLLFHAVAVLSGVALLQQGLLLRPLVLGVLSGWVLGSALFAGDIALRASSATHYFPWRRQPAESYSFWHGSRSLWLPFWRCCTACLAVNFREVVHSVRTGNADVAKPQRFAEDRMDTHKNARLTPKGREEMVRAVVDRGMSKAAAARQFNTTPKIVGKWVGRFCADGVDGLRDRSSRPLSSPSQIPLATADAVENLRRERRTQEHIAAEIGISKASVSRILKRRGLSRLSSLELQEPHPRYEREKPGEIIHLDIKKLGRFSSVGHRVTGRRTGYCSSQGAGWE